ncbi:MAG: hypothetical protein ACTSRI_09095 [Promethearchaeota archaeon]
MEGYKFLIYRELGKKYEDMEDEYMEITIDKIKNFFLSLERKRIALYEAIILRACSSPVSSLTVER